MKGILDALFKKVDSRLPTTESDVFDLANDGQKDQIKAIYIHVQACRDHVASSAYALHIFGVSSIKDQTL